MIKIYKLKNCEIWSCQGEVVDSKGGWIFGYSQDYSSKVPNSSFAIHVPFQKGEVLISWRLAWGLLPNCISWVWGVRSVQGRCYIRTCTRSQWLTCSQPDIFCHSSRYHNMAVTKHSSAINNFNQINLASKGCKFFLWKGIPFKLGLLMPWNALNQ